MGVWAMHIWQENGLRLKICDATKWKLLMLTSAPEATDSVVLSMKKLERKWTKTNHQY